MGSAMNARTIVVLALAVISGLGVSYSPADAQPNPNQRAEAEARAILSKCQQPDQAMQQLCLKNQRDFIREYVRAKAGSEINIRGIASYLRPVSLIASHFEKSLHVGIPPNLQEACAWSLWHAMMPTEGEALTASLPALADRIREKRRSWQPTCLELSIDDRNVSLARAEHLMDEFLSTPARMPPSDWQPKVAGLPVPKPLPPIPKECLITEAPPLNAPEDWPRQKLPRLCDRYR